MRTVLMILYLVFHIIISFPRYIKYKYFTKKGTKRDESIKEYAKKWALSLLKITGSKVKTYGLENIPNDTAVLFIANHQSLFDVPTLLAYVNKPIGFIAKIELFKIPLFSNWIKLLGSEFIDRNNLKQSLNAIINSAENLKNGHSMVIFPEGTRNKGGELHEFKKGSLKPAIKAHVPIVPVAINGTCNIYEVTGKLKVQPANITISFGKPIYLEDLPKDIRKNSATYIRNIIHGLLSSQKKSDEIQ